jgi:hypothetical protein
MYGRILKGFLLSFVILVAVTSTATAAMGQTNGRIVREVRHELVTLPYYGVFDWLQYEVRPNGEVVLRGQVVRPTTRSDAEGRVKEIDGVTSVTIRSRRCRCRRMTIVCALRFIVRSTATTRRCFATRTRRCRRFT